MRAPEIRIRLHLGWQEVGNQLKDQPIDPIRKQMLVAETRAAGERISEGIRQAYSIVVTVNEANAVHAFRIAATGDPLFTTIKADRRARIQETAISAEAMMPDGPYDLWREGEQERRVRDLVGAFAQFAKLPKMLRHKEILGTIVQGIESGIWVGRTMRPDRTYKSYWRTRVDDSVLKDTSLEVCLPESATLSALNPGLLAYGELPELWQGDEISVQSVHSYFEGGRAVQVPKEGYEDTFFIPACGPDQVNEAISQAVTQGSIWMTNGPASILGEPIPAGVLTPAAVLRRPPEPDCGGRVDGRGDCGCMAGRQEQCAGHHDRHLSQAGGESAVEHSAIRDRGRDPRAVAGAGGRERLPGYGSVGRSRCSAADAGGQAWRDPGFPG